MERKLRQYKEKKNDIEVNNKINNETAHNKPIVLTDYNFTESVKNHRVLIVDFWASWCGPCRMVSPVIDQLSAELAGKAVFGKINVDDNPRVSSTFGIQSIPTIIIFKNAQAIDRIIGAMTRTQLISKISPHIERPANSGFNN
jgi:thioredoxin 1